MEVRHLSSLSLVFTKLNKNYLQIIECGLSCLYISVYTVLCVWMPFYISQSAKPIPKLQKSSGVILPLSILSLRRNRVCAVSPKCWFSNFLHLHFVLHLLFVLHTTARGILLKYRSDSVFLLLKNIWCPLNAWVSIK